MKPLTRYAMGTGMNIEPHMAPWPEGQYYRVDKVDAVIRELEAERDAARADAERLREACWKAEAALIGLDFDGCAEAAKACGDAARGKG